MATRKQAGFTLIELILVIAISSALLLIVFAGQRGLRSRVQFDGTMDSVVASLANAHNQATAGVNTTVNVVAGTGSLDCAGNPGAQQKFVFAGISWDAVPSGGTTAITLNYYKSNRAAAPATACIFDTQTVTVPSTVSMAPNTTRILFVRDNVGGLNICRSIAAQGPSANSFASGTCVFPATVLASPVLTFTDPDSHKSDIRIDPSGLAKRLN